MFTECRECAINICWELNKFNLTDFYNSQGSSYMLSSWLSKLGVEAILKYFIHRVNVYQAQ